MRLRSLLLTLALAGCAASQPVYAPPLGVALNCRADVAMTCPRLGCQTPGPQSPSRVELILPSQGEIGRYCIAGTCQEARVRPTMTRALGWTANVSVGPGLSRLVGEVEVRSERQSFVLRQPNAGLLYVWSGLCTPSGS